MPLPEKALLQGIRRRARPSGALVTGIGDDCAVLKIPTGHEVLVTTDFSLEGVHFRRDWHAPEVVGRRCMTRGLSDIAAMGGEPRAAFLSLALEHGTPQRWVQRFLDGLLQAADEFSVSLAGGDMAQSPRGIQADIMLVGSIPRGTAVLRSGARSGDAIYVTGALGGSGAAIEQLRRGKVKAAHFERHFHPVARVEIGNILRRRKLASAMIDLSDGLSTDLNHICQESGVGAEIDVAAIPRARVGHARRVVSLDLALHGGEDYELLFTSSRTIPSRIDGVPVTRIGRVTKRRHTILLSEYGARPLRPRGWEHFRSSAVQKRRSTT